MSQVAAILEHTIHQGQALAIVLHLQVCQPGQQAAPDPPGLLILLDVEPTQPEPHQGPLGPQPGEGLEILSPGELDIGA